MASLAAEISSMLMPNTARLRLNSGRSSSSAAAASPSASRALHYKKLLMLKLK